MFGTRCCVLDQTAWCSGGRSSSFSRLMYSWTGPGSAWTRRTDLPGQIVYHSMVCDQAHKKIWILGGLSSDVVYRYSVESGMWQTMPSLPDRRTYTQSLLCNNSQVLITPGGFLQYSLTDTILLTNTETIQTMKSAITLPIPVYAYVSSCLSV